MKFLVQRQVPISRITGNLSTGTHLPGNRVNQVSLAGLAGRVILLKNESEHRQL